MTTAIRAQGAQHLDAPMDPSTGLTLPLTKFLGSQDLDKHRAVVGFELEVLAKKLDRFGWERDRDSAAHDRMVLDWMDALQDFPLSEIQAACRGWVMESPRKMPNEGDIKSKIIAQRGVDMRKFRASLPQEATVKRDRVDPDTASQILRDAGFAVKRMPGGAA